ncbi:MAG: hypothetical protein E7488_03960 [Ruminococcaceae bacterium]|nr:hypothetical protein [Oscillospiraceae bacterium]
MTQEQQSNITSKEEDKILKVRQGGVVIWGAGKTPYCSYMFIPQEHEYEYKKEIIEEFYSIGYDIIEHYSQNKVCMICCSYDIKEREDDRKHKMTPPVYVEDGKVNEFKQYLINSNRKDLIWTDYMYYVSKITKSKLLRLFGFKEIRSYARDIYILQKKMDLDIVKKTRVCDQEGLTGNVAVFIYPHSEIKHKENDRETVISYVHDRDTLIEICISDFFADVNIEFNPKYITYDQLLKEIEPIFNKYGWKFGDMENPYIKALKCDVNCLECDDLACNYNLKDNVVYHYVYHRVETD